MATVNLYPNDTVENDWDVQSGTTPHANLADSNDSTGISEPDQNHYCVLELDAMPAGTISSVRWYVRGAYVNTRSGDTDLQVVLGKEGHKPISGAASAWYSETFTLTFNAGYTPQDYYGTARTTSDGVAAWTTSDLNSLRLDINTTPEAPDVPGGPPQLARIWKAYVEVTYTPAGYGNDVIGIDSGDISKVNGIATADIDKVSGV